MLTSFNQASIIVTIDRYINRFHRHVGRE